MDATNQTIKKIEDLYTLYGDETNSYFKSKITRTIFMLQNLTTEDCTKEQITEVSKALEQIYNLFD